MLEHCIKYEKNACQQTKTDQRKHKKTRLTNLMFYFQDCCFPRADRKGWRGKQSSTFHRMERNSSGNSKDYLSMFEAFNKQGNVITRPSMARQNQ